MCTASAIPHSGSFAVKWFRVAFIVQSGGRSGEAAGGMGVSERGAYAPHGPGYYIGGGGLLPAARAGVIDPGNGTEAEPAPPTPLPPPPCQSVLRTHGVSKAGTFWWLI